MYKPHILKMDVIEALRQQYADRPHVIRKIDQFIVDLPATLDAFDADYRLRQEERMKVLKQRQEFIARFCDTHRFYYICNSDRFIHYANNVYGHVTEGELSQFIMCIINLDRSLGKIKFKVRNQIIKLIKQTRPITIVLPSPVTEAQVIRALHPSFFATKALARYFLTVVGDIVLGKRGNVYFIDPSFRPFISMMDQEIVRVMNKSISDGFKFKYYDHNYQACRIIPGKAPEHHRLRVNAYDLVAVAVALSTEHGLADNLLDHVEEALKDQIMLLKKNTPNSLMLTFLKDYTLPAGTTPFKDVYFLWSIFLNHHSLPRVISKLNLKHLLTTMGLYEVKGDVCALSPRFSLVLMNFQLFWQKHIVGVSDSNGYDIAELVELYNGVWESNLSITVDECRKWLAETSSNPDLVMDGDRVLNIYCDLWDKTMDIYKFSNAVGDLYSYYVNRTKQYNKMVVTLPYFEAYLDRAV